MKRALVLLFFLSATAIWAADRPRVYVEDSQSWEIEGDIGGSDGSFGGTTKGGARPQTAEIIKTFGDRCSNVIMNNRREKADYVVLLHHEGGKDLVRRDNKVVVFNYDGDAILSNSTRTLGNAVTDACAAITKDWMRKPAVSGSVKESPVEAPPPVASQAKLDITSTPTGADIEINGNFVGSTPSSINLDAGDYNVAIKKNGFSSWERRVKVTGGSVNLVADLQKQ